MVRSSRSKDLKLVVWCTHCCTYRPGDVQGAFICCGGCGKVIADASEDQVKNYSSSSNSSTNGHTQRSKKS